jgi:hypothetical protein
MIKRWSRRVDTTIYPFIKIFQSGANLNMLHSASPWLCFFPTCRQEMLSPCLVSGFFLTHAGDFVRVVIDVIARIWILAPLNALAAESTPWQTRGSCADLNDLGMRCPASP